MQRGCRRRSCSDPFPTGKGPMPRLRLLTSGFTQRRPSVHRPRRTDRAPRMAPRLAPSRRPRAGFSLQTRRCRDPGRCIPISATVPPRSTAQCPVAACTPRSSPCRRRPDAGHPSGSLPGLRTDTGAAMPVCSRRTVPQAQPRDCRETPTGPRCTAASGGPIRILRSSCSRPGSTTQLKQPVCHEPVWLLQESLSRQSRRLACDML